MTSDPQASAPLAVVGIGASAGGLDALRRLLAGLPAHTGMAFVVVQHLSPGRESALAGILGRETTMRVTEVHEDVTLEPDHVYVGAPGHDLVLDGERLRSFPQDPSDRHHPIDRFLSSLAQARRTLSIGVILSGTATDGTLGLEEIKAQGGLTFAQDETAQHEGMPRSAEAAGCVDLVLPPEGIASELAQIAAHEAFTGPLAGVPKGAEGADARKRLLEPVLRRLRRDKGVDFGDFKASTLFRRVRRRMLLARRGDLRSYERLLSEDPAEVEALHQDILIGVTSFFRDPEVWEAVRATVIPGLVEGRAEGAVRVWVLGCSTGEEAYSLAMLIQEAIEAAGIERTVQVFATDLNASAIETARAGIYSKERLHGVSPERLRRFFVEAGGGYRVNKRLRDMCIFARHDLRVDPPFSHIDLVSCRNVLIYLSTSFQEHVLAAVHYALEPGGVLLLGCSESVGALGNGFDTLDARLKIFRKKRVAGLGPRFEARRGAPAERPSRVAPRVPSRSAPRADVHRKAEQVLADLAAPAVLVGHDLEILQFWGATEPYLMPAPGRASLGLLRMAREGLGVPLRTLLVRARKEGLAVREEGVQVSSGDGTRTITLQVIPVRGEAGPEECFLVLFREQDRGGAAAASVPAPERSSLGAEAESEIQRLEHELALSREHVRVMLEEAETAQEELQAVAEEAQSANEEYQSINEELETSKEEIQSTNEELSSVNDQLNARNHELSAVNADLSNLVASVPVAFVIVGRALRIRHVSPGCEGVIGVLPGDIGRPLGDVAGALGLDLSRPVAAVVETAVANDREVRGRDGRWYSLRIRPYLDTERKVDGAVLVLVDVDEMRRARDFREAMVEALRQPVAVLDDQLAVRSANGAFRALFGGVARTVEHRPLAALGAGEWNQPALLQALGRLLVGEEVLPDFEFDYESPQAGHRVVVLNARRLDLPGERDVSLVVSVEDVSERVALAAELRRRNAELEEAARAKDHFLAKLAHELRSPLAAVRGWIQIMQHPEATAEDARTGIEVIDRSSRSQARLIEDLLEVHRLDTGRVTLSPVPVEFGRIVVEALEDAEPQAAARQVRLQRELHDAPLVVLGDPVRLRQVLANLLGNALKFTPEGGCITVSLRRRGTSAEVRVRDTGRGLGAEQLARLFTDPSSREIVQGDMGLGLGLVISKKLVELHGGELSASSPGVGAGATFVVSLPVVDTPVAHEARPDGGSPPGLEGLLVLVVGDDLETRSALQRMLEHAGAAVDGASSVDEALDACAHRRFDAVVSDLARPGRDGGELQRRLRARSAGHGKPVPVVVLTAQPEAADRERHRTADQEMRLGKPLDAGELVAAVATLVGDAGTTRRT